MKYYRLFAVIVLLILVYTHLKAEDGSRLWLRYDLIKDKALISQYKQIVSSVLFNAPTPVLKSAKTELETGLNGLLGSNVPATGSVKRAGTLVAGTPETSEIVAALAKEGKLSKISGDGYVLIHTTYKRNKVLVVAAKSDAGVLYGVFSLLRLMQTNRQLEGISEDNSPRISLRLLNHWDNLDRSVERGYAGLSLWDWKALPSSISTRYADYARANASVGINGTVLTNVNANALILTGEYIAKVAALANIFRNYGIRVYLTARFSAPIEIGKLSTADPLDPNVKKWWKDKADEIYKSIPDFGGFLVKANSEGQPGPQNYGRSHADGANMLAEAVAPHGGIVMWRAFVYDNNVPDDRAKQAYNEFVPLDGKFMDNVIVQVKNGAIDFQPREPFHPLFGALNATKVMPEFQITQEYLGASTHMVFLAPLFEECLKADTWSKGKGSTVAKVIDGSITGKKLTAMAGVANIGSVANWTGHPFAQANWYAYGRLAWDPYLTSGAIADEWVRMTFSNSEKTVKQITGLMLTSREIAVEYMTPLGLHHIMYEGHHYGPGPWVSRGRSDWTSVYYHRADSTGIGFNRTSTGSKATEQYFPEVRSVFDNRATCPENLLLWFHHVPWDYKMSSGRILWDELCFRYEAGVKGVQQLRKEWESLANAIDKERFDQVTGLLAKQERDARIWKDACILYFQTFSGKPLPAGIEKPANDLKFYMNHTYTDIPGITRGL